MSNAPPWYGPPQGQQPPWPPPQPSGFTIGGKTITAVATALVAILGAVGYHYWPTGQNPPAQQAPAKPCGKCGSPDCGCQAAKAGQLQQQVDQLQAAITAAQKPPAVDPSVIEGMQKALKELQDQQKKGAADPFDARNSAKPAHVVDETGRWWTVADAGDPDQRPWYSTDHGKFWLRDQKPRLVKTEPTVCKCPATGNKDGSKGPNNCLCHDLSLDCKCHKNAGITYDVAPAKVSMAQPPPRMAMPMMAPAPMMKPMKTPFFAGSRQAAACST